MRKALLLALLSACGGPAVESDLGEVSLNLVQVPADASCVRAVFTGATRAMTVRLDARPGASATWQLRGIPTGEVVITAEAFPVACAQLTFATVRSWFAAPLVQQIALAAVADIQLQMYR